MIVTILSCNAGAVGVPDVRRAWIAQNFIKYSGADNEPCECTTRGGGPAAVALTGLVHATTGLRWECDRPMDHLFPMGKRLQDDANGAQVSVHRCGGIIKRIKAERAQDWK
ncbi:MAG: hypothetical protein WA825_06935 [Steroidobacteraceae bacterium]